MKKLQREVEVIHSTEDGYPSSLDYKIKLRSVNGYQIIRLSKEELIKLRDRINQALPPPS